MYTDNLNDVLPDEESGWSFSHSTKIPAGTLQGNRYGLLAELGVPDIDALLDALDEIY